MVAGMCTGICKLRGWKVCCTADIMSAGRPLKEFP